MPPFRRPSASTGAMSASSSTAVASSATSRAHKSTESHHVVGQSHSVSSLGSTAGSHQQKIVQVLVNRLRHKLPCNSGTDLAQLEADEAMQQSIEALVDLSRDSLDFISWALCEQMDRLAQQTGPTGHHPLEVLQSQLFLLKVLSAAMASRWSSFPSDARSHSGTGAPDSPLPSSSKRGRGGAASLDTATPPPWTELPALDDNCAKYMLSVMVLFLRQSAGATDDPASLLARSYSDVSFRDYEMLDMVDNGGMGSLEAACADGTGPPSQWISSGMSINGVTSSNASAGYERTHMSATKSASAVSEIIAKFTGKIVFHLSASNWSVVWTRLRNKISVMADEGAEADTTDLLVLSHSVLDKQRLIQILHAFSSLILNMKAQTLEAVAVPLRMAIWNWIEYFPAEFNDVVRSKGKLETAPERCLESLFNRFQPGSEKSLWPTMSLLNAITSSSVSLDTPGGRTHKAARFVSNVLKATSSQTELSDVAISCGLDLCRAATHVQSDGEVPIRMLAFDVAHEIKSALATNQMKKPFWELNEDIDIALCAEALVATFRFLPEEDSLPLFATCVEPERSEAVKTCAVRACLTLVQEASRFSSQRPLVKLKAIVGPRFRAIFNTAGVRRAEFDPNGGVRRIALRPKAKRTVQQPLSDREVMLLGILSLWRARPNFVLKNAENDDPQAWVTTAVKIMEGPNDPALKISTALTCCLIAGLAFVTPPSDPLIRVLVDTVKVALPSMLLCVTANLLQCRNDPSVQRLWTSVAIQILEFYLKKSEYEHVREIQLDPDRVAAFLLAELAFLTGVTSVDTNVARLTARGLRLMSQAERQRGAPIPPLPEEALSKRHPVYEQLGDPKVMVIGRVGQQKRMRKLLRIITDAAPGTGTGIVVWQECYWRWRSLTELIVEAGEETAVDISIRRVNVVGTLQEQRQQWQNLTLFLAAMANLCLEDNVDWSFMSQCIPTHLIPDKLRVVQNPSQLVWTLVNDLVRLLMSDDAQVRDVARDALGIELTPRLYLRLLKRIESIFEGLAQAQPTEHRQDISMFMDQFLSVVKLIVDNETVQPEEILAIDVSAMLGNFAEFISRLNGPDSLRIKGKFCALTDSVCNSTSTLTMRKDAPARHAILDLVVSWIRPPEHLPRDWMTAQVELNMACLRTAVKLLDRLALRPLDSSTGDDALHVVSRLFNKYMNVLLDGLELCQLDNPASDSVSELGSIQQKMKASIREAELRELVITGLANLVSANTDSGFKQCLPLAYHQDNRKRLIFAHAFARVVGQGTKFHPEVKLPSSSIHSKLVELVKQPDMMLALAICETCPATEVDQLISVMLTLFNTRSSLMNLLKELIDREVAKTKSEATFFRGNTTCTRFLSAFGRIHGYKYLRELMKPLIEIMEAEGSPTGPGGYELNPQLAQGENLEENLQRVQHAAQAFLDIILQSPALLPSMFREISVHIMDAVSPHWPASKYSCLGAFIFLRFISPAIVSPEIVDLEVPNEQIRRGLMLIAKIIQNLANNVMFGKEAYMACLNGFLQVHGNDVFRFLNGIIGIEDEAYDDDEWTGTPPEDSDTIILHRFFNRHADKIGKELLSISNISSDGDASIHGKRAWDALCTLLVDLGPPFEVPKASLLRRAEHEAYNNLMSLCEGRDTEPVRHLFLEVDQQSREASPLFVLRMAKVDVETLDIELLMYHVLKTVNASENNKPFEVIVDCTEFSSKSEVPLRWLKFCAEIVPADIRDRFSQTYVLNPNTLTQKYLRRLYNVSAGIPFCGDLLICTSMFDLVAQYPHLSHAVEHLQETFELEKGLRGSTESFDELSVRLGEQPAYHMPSSLSAGSTHIRIITRRSQAITASLSCKAVEFIPLSDIGDIYRTATTQTLPNEFIIRHSRTGSNVFLASPARDEIIRAIRAAKSRLKDARTPVAERFSRFSNVPATLLHVGLQQLHSFDEEVRAAAFGLLGAVCTYLNYDKSPIVISHAGFIPGEVCRFAVQLSETLAEFAPALTLDLGSEVMCALSSTGGMGAENDMQRMACIQYLSPWIKNLNMFCQPAHALYERSGSRVRDSVRMMYELCVQFPEMGTLTQKYVWREIGGLDTAVIDLALDELVRAAVDAGVGSSRCEIIAHIMSAFTSINVRGRLVGRLRKAIIRASPSPTHSIVDGTFWGEVSILVRLTLLAGHQPNNISHNQLFVPEIVHIVTMVSGLGSTLVRKSVYNLVMNLLQSVYLMRSEDSPAPGLSALIKAFTEPEGLQLFGLQRATPTSEYSSWDAPSDKITIDNQEHLTVLLCRLLECAAGTNDLLNVWRARWMSLATASAFQHFSVVQMRSFTSLANLAVANVDDDYCYQMLVAFRSALGQATESNTLAIVSMLRCFTKIIPALPARSNHRPHLFWLSVAFLQSSHIAFYVEAAALLCTTIEDMEAKGYFENEDQSAVNVLLSFRSDIEEIAVQLDQLLGLSCDSNFSFALAPVIFKGARFSGTRDMAEKALRTLAGVTVRMSAPSDTASFSGGSARSGRSGRTAGEALHPDVLGYCLALLPFATTAGDYRNLLKDCGLDEEWLPVVADMFEDESSIPHVSPMLLGINDSTTALLATSFISGMLSSAQGDDAETEVLYSLLSQISVIYPDVVAMAYDGLHDRIKDSFANSTNAAIIGYVSEILRVATYDQPSTSPSAPVHHSSRSVNTRGSASTLNTLEEAPQPNHGSNHVVAASTNGKHASALEEIGLQGLANNFQFLRHPGQAARVIQWIPSLVTCILQS